MHVRHLIGLGNVWEEKNGLLCVISRSRILIYVLWHDHAQYMLRVS